MDRMQQFERRYGAPIVRFREWFKRVKDDGEDSTGEKKEGSSSSSSSGARAGRLGAWISGVRVAWWGAVREWVVGTLGMLNRMLGFVSFGKVRASDH